MHIQNQPSPLSEDESKLLKKAFDNEKPLIWLFVLAGFGTALFITISHGRRNRHASLSEIYGFWPPFLLLSTALQFLLICFYFEKISNFKKDISDGLKDSARFKVMKKEALSSNRFSIDLDSDIQNFKQVKVEKHVFDAIEPGSEVTVFFTLRSKIVFNVEI